MKNTWIELDLDVLRSNIGTLKRVLSAGTNIVLVVKSEAYGHGLCEVARCAWNAGVKMFAVAHVDEGVRLRSILPQAKIIVVGVVSPDDVLKILRENLVPLIVSENHARALAEKAAGQLSAVQCHAKIDTGMGRIGFLWESAADVVPRLSRTPGLKITGLCTHFASADEEESGFADIQAARFYQVWKSCREKGMQALFRHISNSSGILRSATWDMDGVRPGILIYGYGSNPMDRTVECRPFLHWKTRLLQVKAVPADFPVSYGSTFTTREPTRLGTIDVGYADGYSRQLSNKGVVLVGSRRCPIVGRVTMNLTVVDLGNDSEAKEGDEIVLIGAQGASSVWADEIAQWCNTIPYEVLVNIRTDARTGMALRKQ
ncbi:MAG: alanine racemase [Kiritimatiellia bacterium]|jgi:alanine racemase|nr:alanine racemase [Kiritimatiellia bacterium]MDP6848520.1 alanine racemase [Kiritimatiellia bacterium]